MKSFSVALLTSVVSLSSGVNAWWDSGHILIAKIAEDILDQEAPKVKATILKWM